MPKQYKFHRLLKARGMSVGELVRLTGSGRSHFSKVINHLGYGEIPTRGRHLKPKLFALLTVEEIDALGWRPEYELWLASAEKRQLQKFLLRRHLDLCSSHYYLDDIY
jgi:hypothetical protein